MKHQPNIIEKAGMVLAYGSLIFTMFYLIWSGDPTELMLKIISTIFLSGLIIGVIGFNLEN